jgi:hypothetical protein
LWPPALERSDNRWSGAKSIGTVGTAFSETLDASSFSGAVTYSASGLNGSGLSVDPKSGLISGTPTTAGNYNVTATATSGSQTASLGFTLVITPNGVGTNIVTPDPSYPYATLEYLSPSVARPGDTVVITGAKFNSTANQNVVGFRDSSNAIAGTTVATASTGSSLTFVVPASLAFGNYQVSVGINPVVSQPSANSLPLTVGSSTGGTTPVTTATGGTPPAKTVTGNVVIPGSTSSSQTPTSAVENALLGYYMANPLTTTNNVGNTSATNSTVSSSCSAANQAILASLQQSLQGIQNSITTSQSTLSQDVITSVENLLSSMAQVIQTLVATTCKV